MIEFFQTNQAPLIIIYGCILLYINISYLREHKQVNEGLQEISSQEVYIKTESLTVILLTLGFAFFRSWLIYLLAYNLTGNIIIAFLLGIFIIMDAYHAIFNYTVEKLKKTKIVWFRSITDTLFITVFMIYYMLYLI
ncbi:hypothetical protein [Gracilibacillus alcaliphilus]|uniref:hypothetical protein n=1 Tax=Gracilibacillus alcaliphilus TaxID=1401441 RepID=UPI00195A6689|nr:hypothetical protein [Gracilibacillus alcaliphilus]MBM7676163.1 putative membrane protein [Gracilibacillus alcaliphilus]